MNHPIGPFTAVTLDLNSGNGEQVVDLQAMAGALPWSRVDIIQNSALNAFYVGGGAGEATAAKALRVPSGTQQYVINGPGSAQYLYFKGAAAASTLVSIIVYS